MSQVQYEQAPPPEAYTDMTVGEILRRAREYYGQSLAYVESVLRIRASQLDALETGNLEALPGRVYAIGFVRSYSEYLGLDGDQMVRLFKEQTANTSKNPELHFPVAASESKAPSFIVILGSLLALIAVVGIWAILHSGQSAAPSMVPPVPEALKESSITEAPAIVSSPDEAELLMPESEPRLVEPEKPANRIILEVNADSWIEIRSADGAVILQRILKAGDQYLVPDEDGLTLSTGNAGGFKLRIDGEYLVSLGGKGDVRKNVALDADAFLKKKN